MPDKLTTVHRNDFLQERYPYAYVLFRYVFHLHIYTSWMVKRVAVILEIKITPKNVTLSRQLNYIRFSKCTTRRELVNSLLPKAITLEKIILHENFSLKLNETNS